MSISIRYYSTIAMYYGKTEVRVNEEFLIYDFNTIVATIGGSLGLFLGFSCVEVARGGLEKVRNIIKSCSIF